MAKTDVMSVEQIQALGRKGILELINNAQAALKAAEVSERQAAIDEMKAAAEKYGFSFNELVGGAPTGTKRRASGAGRNTDLPAKYQHPENGALTWTGRGRMPNWLKEAVDGGAALDDYLVK